MMGRLMTHNTIRGQTSLRKWFGSLNHYETLGVSPAADFAQIKKNYLVRSKQLHPDKNKVTSEDNFIRLQLAYKLLMDPQQRRRYDISLGIVHSVWEHSPSNTNFQSAAFDEILAETEPKGKLMPMQAELRQKYGTQSCESSKYIYTSLFVSGLLCALLWAGWTICEVFYINHTGSKHYVIQLQNKENSKSATWLPFFSR